jgi:hypothetical protein
MIRNMASALIGCVLAAIMLKITCRLYALQKTLQAAPLSSIVASASNHSRSLEAKSRAREYEKFMGK